jgi:hypothetical protein
VGERHHPGGTQGAEQIAAFWPAAVQIDGDIRGRPRPAQWHQPRGGPKLVDRPDERQDLGERLWGSKHDPMPGQGGAQPSEGRDGREQIAETERSQDESHWPGPAMRLPWTCETTIGQGRPQWDAGHR